MTQLLRYKDTGKQCWASLRMENGEPCFISVGRDKTMIKRSTLGLFGEVIFEEKNISVLGLIIYRISDKFENDLTPPEMTNLALKNLTNIVLNCKNLIEVSLILNDPSNLLAD